MLLEDVMKQYTDRLEAIARPMTFKKGESIYMEGSLPKGAYYIKRGKVKIEQINAEANVRIVYVYTPDEYFGFRPLLSDEKHPVSAIAIEETELEFYNGRNFLEIARESSGLSFNLVKILSYEFNVWINLITSLSHKSAKERVALVLLILNQKYKGANGEQAEIGMSRADIGNYSETTEETVVRILRSFEEHGIIGSVGRRIVVADVKMLEVIAEGF